MNSFCHIYAQFDQTGSRLEEEARHLLDLGLVCDTTFRFAQGSRNHSILQKINEVGGLCAPNIYPIDCDAGSVDPNWWKYSEKECLKLIQRASERFAALDLGAMQAVNTYTPGNDFVSACRKLNIGYILGFCAPTVIEDGGWSIAHYGSPLSPYFVSEEDFRKPTDFDGSENAVLIASMELRNPMVCRNHWSEGPWCPLNAQAVDRWLEPSADPLPFLQIAEDWLRQSELTGERLFFHINLQYFFAGRCYEHNRRALEWLADQRDKGRLEVGGLKSWKERLAKEGGLLRQTSYWRGEMMGSHVGHRPGCFPDVIVDECLGHQAVWQTPDPLPQRLYDYETIWDYPAFRPDGSAPASQSFNDIDLTITKVSEDGLVRDFAIEINNRGGSRKVPLMIWDALKGGHAPFTAKSTLTGWRGRMVPHPSGIGGAVLLEGIVAEGRTNLKVSVAVESLAQQTLSRSWDDLVAAQTFFRHGRPYTILAAQTPEPFLLLAKIIRGPNDHEPIIAESLIGIDHEKGPINDNQLPLHFDGTRLTCWHRFWGVRADQIELIGVEETKAELKTKTQALLSQRASSLQADGPGYQLFGNIRNPSRWDRALARTAGLEEMRKMNDWFRKQRPSVGEVVIEVHPGLFLPRGSITKVLGHEFDVITCADGYDFQELCVDYPQGWDWGVAAWVQWRHLRVRLDGLRSGSGRYLLHLHAFDPEDRNLVQRVHFYNPSEPAAAPLFEHIELHQQAELCGVREWVLPGGLEGRWKSEALCSVLIPQMCLDWPSIGIWIAPLEKSTLYDWIEERGAPGLISHLWVTCHPSDV